MACHETYAHEAMVIFVCQPIYDQHELEHARFAAEAMNRAAEYLHHVIPAGQQWGDDPEPPFGAM